MWVFECASDGQVEDEFVCYPVDVLGTPALQTVVVEDSMIRYHVIEAQADGKPYLVPSISLLALE